MAIDYDGILDKFILVAVEAVGSSLTQIGPAGSKVGAVVRARQKNTKPSPPYVTIDVLDTKDESGWLYNETIDVNEDTVLETTKQLLLNYRVYGGNAINLANNLHGFFRLDRVRGDIRKTLGGSVVTVDSVEQLPVLQADEFLESASFNFIFNITDTFIDTTGSEVFDIINLTGEVFRSEGDTDPLDVSITVPTP